MVLEARKNAKSVGFPIVGDDEKDASNVINYNINEEITKDKTAVINANNDTTTGMAGVVPGINAPKLIWETSIYGDGGGGGGGGLLPKSKIMYGAMSTSGTGASLHNWTITQTGNIYSNGSYGIVVSEGGWYLVSMFYELSSAPAGLLRGGGCFNVDSSPREYAFYIPQNGDMWFSGCGLVRLGTNEELYISYSSNHSISPSFQLKIIKVSEL